MAWSGWGPDLSFDWTAVWSQWFGGADQSASFTKTGSALDPDGSPEGDDDNTPVNDPPATASVQVDSPEITGSGGS